MSVKDKCEGLAVSILSSERQDSHKQGILKSYAGRPNSEKSSWEIQVVPQTWNQGDILDSRLPSHNSLPNPYPVTPLAIDFFILYISCA